MSDAMWASHGRFRRSISLQLYKSSLDGYTRQGQKGNRSMQHETKPTKRWLGSSRRCVGNSNVSVNREAPGLPVGQVVDSSALISSTKGKKEERKNQREVNEKSTTERNWKDGWVNDKDVAQG